jgi:hypothetical protein
MEEGVPERVAPAVCGFPQRTEFSREQTVWVLLWLYSKIHRAPQETSFFAPAVFYSRRAPRGVLISCFGCASCAHFISWRAKSNTAGVKTALQEILLLEEIQS